MALVAPANDAYCSDDDTPILELHRKGKLNAGPGRLRPGSATRATFLEIAVLVHTVVTAQHLQAKYDHGSVLRMRAVARLMRSVKALYTDFRKDFDQFFVPKGRALASYITDTDFGVPFAAHCATPRLILAMACTGIKCSGADSAAAVQPLQGRVFSRRLGWRVLVDTASPSSVSATTQ